MGHRLARDFRLDSKFRLSLGDRRKIGFHKSLKGSWLLERGFGQIEGSLRLRRIVALEFAQQFILEIEGRLLSGGIFDGICCYPRLEADDAGKFRQRIIVSKEVRILTRVIRPLFVCHTHPTRNC